MSETKKGRPRTSGGDQSESPPCRVDGREGLERLKKLGTKVLRVPKPASGTQT